MKRLFLFFSLMIFTLFGGLLLAVSAQEESAPEETATPEPIDCSAEALVLRQAELMALLEDFEANLADDESAALGALYEVGAAYQEIALTCGYIPDDVDSLVINTTDLERVLTVLETLNGDPINGQLLYNGEIPAGGGVVLGCFGCHNDGIVAPYTEGTWTRWDEERRLLPEYEDKTFEYYTAESILLPWDYFVPPYPEFTMPDFYHSQLSYQDLADLIAYLESQDQFLEE